MSKIKKIIIITPITLFLGVIILISLITQTQPKKPFIPAPKIPSALKGKYELRLNIPESQFKFPNELPLISIDNQTPLTKEESDVVAKNLGFSGEAKVANDVFEGTTYIWNNINSSLFSYSKTRKIRYSTNKTDSVINKQLSDEDIKKIAKDFLVKNFYSENANNASDEIEFTLFTFLKTDPREAEQISITNKNNASIYQVNFSPKGASNKILTLDPKSSPIYVWVLPDGSIKRANVVKFKDLKSSDNNFKLKSYQEVANNINSAVVVSLDDGNINLIDLPEGSLKEITINSIDLSYLLDSPTSTFLQPIFTLKGTAKITGSDKEISAFLYFPAVSN